MPKKRKLPYNGRRAKLAAIVEELVEMRTSSTDKENTHGQADQKLLDALRLCDKDAAAVADAWEETRNHVGFWYA